MGIYHLDPNAVLEGRIGRTLEAQGTTFMSYVVQLEPGEALWLGARRGSRYLVVSLYDEIEFDRIYARSEDRDTYIFYAIRDE